MVLLEYAPIHGIDLRSLGARAIDLAPHVPTEGTAYHRIRRPVLFSDDASRADRTGEAIGKDLRHRPGIFARKHAGRRPTHSRGVRRKRIPAIPELPLVVSGEGPFALSDILQRR